LWLELFRRGLAPVTLTACLGEGVSALNTFLVSTAMPLAVRDLGGIRYLAWTTTVFLVAAMVAGAATGFLKGQMGARRLLLGASLLFFIGTLVAGAAPSMLAILAGRALQGAGEGVIAAACYTLVIELLPQALVPKSFGVMAVVWAIAAFGGPLLGGIMTELFSWRAAFLVNVPIILAFTALVMRAVPRGGARQPSASLPFARLLGIAGGIMLIAIAAVSEGRLAAAALIVLGLAILVAVTLADRRAAVRLFPGDAFSLKTTVGAGLWVVLLMPLAQSSTSVYLPISIQSLWGYSPTEAGALIAMMAVSWSGTAMLVALPRDSRFAVPLIRIGAVLLVLGMIGVAIAVPGRLPVLLAICQVLNGAGFGVGWGYLNQAVAMGASPAERDLASALVPTTQSAGYAIGAAVAGLVANASGYSGALATHGSAAMAAWIFGVGAAIATIAVLASFRVRPVA